MSSSLSRLREQKRALDEERKRVDEKEQKLSREFRREEAKLAREAKINRREGKRRTKEVKLSYRDKQKALREAENKGLVSNVRTRKPAKILNIDIIKATDVKHRINSSDSSDPDDSDNSSNSDDSDETESSESSDEEKADDRKDAINEGFIPIEETTNVVKQRLIRGYKANRNDSGTREAMALHQKFRVTFQSYLNPRITTTVPRTITFYNWYHYRSWINTLSKMDPAPRESTATLRVLAKIDDVFKYVKLRVSVVKGGCNKHKSEVRTIKTPLYKLEVISRLGAGNNCGLRCIEEICDVKFRYSKIRERYNIDQNCMIDTHMITQLYDEHNKVKGRSLEIIEIHFNDEFDFEKKSYLLVKGGHYYMVESAERLDMKNKKTKRGLLTWDIETRPSEKTVKIKHYDYIEVDGVKEKKESIIESQILMDTITAIYYRDYKSDEDKKQIFVTDNESSSIRKFIEFLKLQSMNGNHYNCVAHNASRFDHYFLLSEMSRVEQLQTEYQFRGYAVIGLQFCSHLFKDSYCFLTESLDSLCKSFKISSDKCKQKIIKYNGKELTNEQLCFYKPELTFDEFMDLQTKEKKFWDLYERYCLYDCISLFTIWSEFTKVTNDIIKLMDPRLSRTCGVNYSNTIGALSMKIVRKMNCFKENKDQYNNFEKFVNTKEKFDFVNGADCDESKYVISTVARLNSQKTGGISHCAMPGHHKEEISSVDIASQYPASLVEMWIPVGESKFVTSYHSDMYGFYQLKNLEFDCDLKLKPICEKIEGESLKWSTGKFIKQSCLDSYMIKYLQKHYGLKKFDVVRGLVSHEQMKGRVLFGLYVDKLYKAKADQDIFKKNDENLEKELKTKGKQFKDSMRTCNAALRSTIKLMLNALTGKLNEEIHKYYTTEVSEEETNCKIGAINLKKEKQTKYNMYITAGVMTYSYSKRLLFEYIRCLPNNSNDVIHIETDSIYFKSSAIDKFFDNIKKYKGKEYPIALGPKLGNVKIEKDRKKDTYFLGKKFYYIDEEAKKIKGIPGKTITNDGTEMKLVDKQLFIDVYNGKEVTKTFKTMKKQLFAVKIYISTYDMTRTIKSSTKYKEYSN